MMGYKTLLAPTIALLLSGCVVGPNYKAPEAVLPAKYSESKDRSSDNVRLNPWWEKFRDKRLNSLVAQGMNENLGVQAAMERIVEAQANVVIAGAGAYPQITKLAGATTEGRRPTDAPSVTVNTASAGVQVSWLLDLFGQYKRQKESAKYLLDAAFDDVNVVRLAYFSAISSAYVDMRFFQESIALNQQNLASRRESLKLINDIKEAGSASRLDVVQAEGLVNQTLSQIPTLETGYHVAANRIATLLAQPAASMTKGLARGYGQPMPRYNTKTGVPADLIRNRPDVREAERVLAALTAQIGVAEADLYPAISLNGVINGARLSTDGVSSGLLSWSFGPSLTLPIFDGYARRANVDAARSQAEQQYLAWKSTVLNAVEEVENAQIALNRNYQTVAALRRLVTSYEEQLALARESYKGGTATVLDILDAERNVADGRISLAAAIRDLALNYIALNVAIGGGSDIGDQTKTQ